MRKELKIYENSEHRMNNRKNNRKKALTGMLALAMALTAAGYGSGADHVNATVVEDASDAYEDAQVITLNEDTAVLDGQEIQEYNYTWHKSPDSAEEWYEGDEPDTDAAVYIAHDIWYYPELDTDGFTMQNYDGENEWVYHYTMEGLTDYIFSTLPVLGEDLPVEMMHTEEEAYANKVLHITKAGTYVLQGTWKGQIFVDLGEREDTFSDPDAKVTLVMNGVDVTCDCAPAVIFYSAYECDNEWEAEEEHSNEVSTEDAGAKVEIMNGTVNSFTGANVYRLLKAEYKKNSDSVQKKAYKLDGAFYSFVSMEINGGDAGIMNVTSTTFEGLDSELHLTINGGNVNIYSQDDAINVNEDDVSVFTMNGGQLHIFAGLGAEGDGIDSNGYIVVNGGVIAGGTPSGSDSLLDSDCGTTLNGGEVITIGSNSGNAFGMQPGGQGMQPPEGFDMLPGGQGSMEQLPRDGEDFEELPKGDGSFGMLPGGKGSMEQLPKDGEDFEELPKGSDSDDYFMEELPKDDDELEALPNGSGSGSGWFWGKKAGGRKQEELL